MKFILAKKVNMTQVFMASGKVVPVTALKALACRVTAVMTDEKHGYKAVQIGDEKTRAEFRTDEAIEIGHEIKVSDFEIGDVIDIVGVSKGRGFAGAVKRHGFHGAPASHGHDHPRAVGSIGQRFPQHTRKGLRMAGHMGAAQATVKHSVVVAVDPGQNLILVKGGVPGHPTSVVEIKTTGGKKEIGEIVKYNTSEIKEAKPEATQINES